MTLNSPALLVIDAQVGLFENASRPAETISRIRRLIERARERAVPVVYLQHDGDAGGRLAPGSAGWRIHPDLAPGPRAIWRQSAHSSVGECAIWRQIARFGTWPPPLGGLALDRLFVGSSSLRCRHRPAPATASRHTSNTSFHNRTRCIEARNRSERSPSRSTARAGSA